MKRTRQSPSCSQLPLFPFLFHRFEFGFHPVNSIGTYVKFLWVKIIGPAGETHRLDMLCFWIVPVLWQTLVVIGGSKTVHQQQRGHLLGGSLFTLGVDAKDRNNMTILIRILLKS